MTYFVLGAQIVLGLMFLMAGVMKLLMQEKARSMTPALRLYPPAFISFIGLAELAGSLGITLPVWLSIAPFLAPLAALGLVVIMLGATYSHLRLKEYPNAMFALLVGIALGYLIHVWL